MSIFRRRAKDTAGDPADSSAELQRSSDDGDPATTMDGERDTTAGANRDTDRETDQVTAQVTGQNSGHALDRDSEQETGHDTGATVGSQSHAASELTADPSSGAASSAERPELEVNRSAGPFDRSEVTDSGGRLDLGSLWLGGGVAMELRLEVDEASQVVAANAIVGDSAVHLQAFAAPRSEGLWPEIRTEIAGSITRQGGTADEVHGPLGVELRAQMPAQGPGGRTVYAPARFVGVDGPRWFLRAVISGRAASDDAAAGPVLDIVRDTVVVRGVDAMAPRDLLPLRLPPEASDADGADASEPQADGFDADGPGRDTDPGDPTGRPGGGRGSVDDLSPFARGPEITEIR